MSGKRTKKLWAVGVGHKGNMDVEIHKSINPPKAEKEKQFLWTTGEVTNVYFVPSAELVSLCAKGFREATGIRIKLGEVRELFVRVH